MDHLNSVASSDIEGKVGIEGKVARRRVFSLSAITPPSYTVVKDVIRFSDGLVLLGSSLVERVPAVQDMLTATSDHNHLLANIVGGCVSFGMLSTAEGYKIRILKKFPKQAKRLFIAVAAGGAGVYV